MASPIRILGTALRWLAPVLVIALGAVVARALILGRQAPPRVERPPRVLPVDVVTVDVRDHAATIAAYGTVRPLRTLVLRPTVGGPVREIHPELIEGGRIDAMEELIVIDERDYSLAVATASADVVAAQSELDIELGSASVAEREWKLLEGSVEVTEAGKRLALREPYVARRRSDLDAAKARLEQAKIDLERTRIVAPFDALVLSEDVEIGAQASVGTEIARLVDRSRFVIDVSVPTARLALLDLDGAPAHVAQETGVREGRIERLLGEVDAAGRMARLQVSISDPLGQENGATPVLLGSYVEVDLPCRPIPQAVSVPRTALREGDVVWIVDGNDRLEIRPVQIIMRRTSDVLVTGGLVGGERVVVSPIAVPLPGMLVAPSEGPGTAAEAAATAMEADQ